MDLSVLKIGVNAVDDNMTRINSEYKECFEGIGKLTDYQLKFHIDSTVRSVAQQQYRLPFSLRDKVEQKLNKLEEKDIIEKVNGPTPWVSPVICVPKPDGDIRLCVDMRQANKAIIRERHPIPTIDEVLSDMDNSQVLSKLDLRWGYHQVELTPHGIGPAEDKVKAVLEARRPESASEDGSFLGLVQFNIIYTRSGNSF